MALAHTFIETKISLCLCTVFVDCAALKGGGCKVTQMAVMLQNSMGALKTFNRKLQYIWGGPDLQQEEILYHDKDSKAFKLV